MKSRILTNGSPLPERSARRSATVTISVPLASSAAAIAWFDENLPVPSSSRERKARPAMMSGSWSTGMLETCEDAERLASKEIAELGPDDTAGENKLLKLA